MYPQEFAGHVDECIARFSDDRTERYWLDLCDRLMAGAD